MVEFDVWSEGSYQHPSEKLAENKWKVLAWVSLPTSKK